MLFFQHSEAHYTWELHSPTEFHHEPLSSSTVPVTVCAVLTGSITADQHAKQSLCRHACSPSLHHCLSLNISSSNSWCIHSNLPTDKPSHLLTYPLSAVTNPLLSKGLRRLREPSFGQSKYYTDTIPPQSNLISEMKRALSQHRDHSTQFWHNHACC